MATFEEKHNLVVQYVISERERQNIVVIDRATKPEISAEAMGGEGEFESLIDRQLLTTEVGFGSWAELNDSHVLDGVLRVIGTRSA